MANCNMIEFLKFLHGLLLLKANITGYRAY